MVGPWFNDNDCFVKYFHTLEKCKLFFLVSRFFKKKIDYKIFFIDLVFPSEPNWRMWEKYVEAYFPSISFFVSVHAYGFDPSVNSVFTPYYSETVLYSSSELRVENEDGISVLFYLQKIFPGISFFFVLPCKISPNPLPVLRNF